MKMSECSQIQLGFFIKMQNGSFTSMEVRIVFCDFKIPNRLINLLKIQIVRPLMEKDIQFPSEIPMSFIVYALSTGQ